MSGSITRALAVAASAALVATVSVAMVAGPTAPAEPAAADGMSVSCYNGIFDGWYANPYVGATGDSYDRDAEALEAAPSFTSPPRYEQVRTVSSTDSVLANDYQYIDLLGETRSPVQRWGAVAHLWDGPDHAKSFTLNPDGTFVWVPQDGYWGGDSFQYVYSDDVAGSPCSNVATVTIKPATLARLVDDAFVGYRDEPLRVGKLVCGIYCGVLENDLNWSGDNAYGWGAYTAQITRVAVQGPGGGWNVQPLSNFTSQTTFRGGTVSQVGANGSFVYTPPPGFVGTDTFLYHAASLPKYEPDAIGAVLLFGERYARVTITIKEPWVPELPRPAEDGFVTDEDASITLTSADLLGNDVNTNYVRTVSGATVSGQTPIRTAHGRLDLAWRDVIPGVPLYQVITGLTYTPDPDFTGVDRFRYTGSDAPFDGSLADGGVVFEVAPTPDAPVARDDLVTTLEDREITIDLVANDTDADGDFAPETTDFDDEYPGGGSTWHGVWTLQGDGSVHYVPDPEFTGEAVYRYVTGDAAGHRVRAKAVVTVTADDAVDDAYETAEDAALSVSADGGVLANDDPEAVADAPVVTAAPTHGAVDLAADGSFTYEPAADFSGTDSFTYEAGGDSGVATITVAPVNDEPTVALRPWCDRAIAGIVCIQDEDERDVIEGGTVELRGSIADPEKDVGTYAIEWGDGSTTTGAYPCSDEEAACPFTEEPTWSTGCLGDCPQYDGPLYFAFEHRYADDPSGSGNGVTIEFGVRDTGDGPVAAASGGARVANSPPQLFIPTTPLTGVPGEPVTLAGTIADPGFDTEAITIDWGDGSEPTELSARCDALAADPVCPTPSLQPADCATQATASAACGDFAVQHTYATGGSKAISVTAIDDDGAVANAEASAEITWVNSPPSASSPAIDAAEDHPRTLDLAELVDDLETADADLVYELTSLPARGTAVLDGSVVTFTPIADAHGLDGFGYRVTDRGAPDACGAPGDECAAPLSAEGRVVLDLVAINDAPSFTAGDDQDAVADGQPRTMAGWATAASAGPADESGQGLHFEVVVDDPSLFAPDGQPSVAADGTLTFTPVATGTAAVTVMLVDDGPSAPPHRSRSLAASFSIEIASPNLPPVITAPAARSLVYSDASSTSFTATDPEDGTTGLTITASGLPAGLALTAGAAPTLAGVVTAVPGTYPVVLRACDAQGACAEASVAITVAAERATVRITSPSGPIAAPVDGTAPAFTVTAVVSEDADGSPGDLGRITPADVRVTLTPAAGPAATCTPLIGTVVPGTTGRPGTVTVTCRFAAGTAPGTPELRVAVGGSFAGSTVTRPVIAEPPNGAAVTTLANGNTAEFRFRLPTIAPIGVLPRAAELTYLERRPNGALVTSMTATSVLAYAVTGPASERRLVVTGLATLDGRRGQLFVATMVDRGAGIGDSYQHVVSLRSRSQVSLTGLPGDSLTLPPR
ncbi:tandem-95 repeat protein [Agromyces sp. CFH 90414]|uniref:Tandem-95 repeat protein n=1 Tax=Agromyces agglutinans TaxID=2662258 RepID=A0A6I2FFM2_9MICO|nr:Ig-like domain-containing protein [Agromyces agglutinans]MRG60703.1 tandem-95 repeat protein [Agromyces agglutinans]